jgi:hypothetical protein
LKTIAHIKIDQNNFSDKFIKFVNLPNLQNNNFNLNFLVERVDKDYLVDVVNLSSQHIIINIKENDDKNITFKKIIGSIKEMNVIEYDKWDEVKIELSRYEIN